MLNRSSRLQIKPENTVLFLFLKTALVKPKICLIIISQKTKTKTKTNKQKTNKQTNKNKQKQKQTNKQTKQKTLWATLGSKYLKDQASVICWRIRLPNNLLSLGNSA